MRKHRVIRLFPYCLPTTGTASFAAAETASFEGSAQGFGSQVKVKVDLDGGKVIGLDVDDSGETYSAIGVSRADSVEKFIAAVIEAGNADEVDVHTGATYTCKAIKEVVDNALAGGKAEVSTETTLKDGTYTATVPSLIDLEGLVNVGEMTLEATFKDNKIESITVPKYTDTQVIGGIAFEELAKKIVENQSTAVDALSGATVSSNAFLNALDLCIEQAGGDPAALKARELPAYVPETKTYETDVVVVGAGMAGLC